MRWLQTTGSDAASAPIPLRERTIWDLAILVLGLNIWTGFLLLPALHLEQRVVSLGIGGLLALGPLCLVLGTWLRHGILLLVVYPVALLAPAVAAPSLVGANIYSPWTFVMVAVSLLAYLLATPLLLGLLRSGSAAAEEEPYRDLEEFPYTAKWRRRIRLYRGLALLAGLFPAVLVFTLYLHPGVQADLARNFPGRLSEALALFGLLLLLLWLGLFNTYFLAPLKAHIRGDPQVRYEIQRLRREVFRRGVRGGFYVYVVAALLLMAILVLVHW